MIEEVYTWGLSVIHAFQSIRCVPLDAIANFIHVVFNKPIYLIILMFIYWCVDIRKGFRMTSVVLLSSCVNDIYKDLLKIPRPYTKDPSVGLAVENSFSTPSGHSQTAATFWPLFAISLKKAAKWLKILIAVGIPLIIGLSRIYLGVHYPTDVIIGLIFGYIFSIGFLLFNKPVTIFVAKLPLMYKILACAIIAFILNSLDMEKTAMPGLFFGFSTGYLILRAKGGFDAHTGTLLQKVLRLVIGFAITAGFYVALKAIFPVEESAYYKLFHFLRYAICGFAIAFLIPRLFILMRIGTALPVKK